MSIQSQEGICVICLSPISGQDVGSPDTCKHVFCLHCLIKWSKESNICPIDNQQFEKINVIHFDQIQVTARKKRKERQLYDFTVFCEACTNRDENQLLILCDSCNLAYHLSCLSPPLSKAPPGDWFCPTCLPVMKTKEKTKTSKKEMDKTAGIQTQQYLRKKAKSALEHTNNKGNSVENNLCAKNSTEYSICKSDLKKIVILKDGSLLFNTQGDEAGPSGRIKDSPNRFALSKGPSDKCDLTKQSTSKKQSVYDLAKKNITINANGTIVYMKSNS